MKASLSRRHFLQGVAGSVVLAGGSAHRVAGQAAVKKETKAPPRAPDHTLTIIAGKPRERGLQYGKKFKIAIHAFLEKEIYQTFVKKPPTKDELLRYAGSCIKHINTFAPEVLEELAGIAEGADLRAEEVVLITLHEELWHKGKLPAVEHCTAIAAGPPDTKDGNTYVGQNWDWMESVYGQSSMLLWKRSDGPSLLSYSYPGLWVGAGLNSAGLALCWTSAQGLGIPGPRPGVPSYVLIAQMLYQDSLDDAVEEVLRAENAGWFTFVVADGKGNLANVEGSPTELAVEFSHGHLARVYYGTRLMTRTPRGEKVKYHPQCQRMCALLEGSRGQLDRGALQRFFGDHDSTICKHYGTLDSMLFNTTLREAYVSRGPGCSGRWQRFGFDLK